MVDTTVKYFNSTMSGAPSVTASNGSGITLLDACCVTGFGTVTLNSLVIADNIATATVSGGHGFAMLGLVGPVLRIEGATPSALNAEWRVTVTSTTQFTFVTTGISNQTATGTITAKRAPLGFSKIYSGANKAAYQPNALSSNRLYLRFDDSYGSYAAIKGYVTMSDVDTGTEQFPSGNTYLNKIYDLASAPWSLIGDDRSFYWFLQTNSNGVSAGAMFFGDLAYPIADVDTYATGLIGGNYNSAGAVQNLENTDFASMARSYTQLSGSVSLYRYSHSRAGQVAYPCAVNNGILAVPMDAWESNIVPRGMMPGVYYPLNSVASFTNKTVFDNVAGINRSLIAVKGYAGCLLFDLNGPWRST